MTAIVVAVAGDTGIVVFCIVERSTIAAVGTDNVVIMTAINTITIVIIIIIIITTTGGASGSGPAVFNGRSLLFNMGVSARSRIFAAGARNLTVTFDFLSSARVAGSSNSSSFNRSSHADCGCIYLCISNFTSIGIIHLGRIDFDIVGR